MHVAAISDTASVILGRRGLEFDGLTGLREITHRAGGTVGLYKAASGSARQPQAAGKSSGRSEVWLPRNPSRCRQAVKRWACLGRVHVAGSAVQPRSSASAGAAVSSASLSVRGAVDCCCRQAPGAIPWWRRKVAANA